MTTTRNTSAKNFFLSSFVLVLVLFSISCAPMQPQSADAQQSTQHRQSDTRIPFTQEDTVGYWQSVNCDSTRFMGANDGNIFFRRFYIISLTSAVVRYSFYADSACQQPLYSFRVFAWSERGKARTDMPHTREELVVFDTQVLAADSTQGQKFLGSCGASSWIIGQEYDVTLTGCKVLGMKPRSQCIGDYDLERMENGELTFGYRAENMCTPAGRPTRTQTVWVKKVSPQDFKG